MAINYIDVVRSKVEQALYSNEEMDFTRKYDSMYHYPISYYLPWEVVCQINKLVTSLKYSDKVSYKKKEISNILYPFGFRKFASGTNRITFRYLDDRSFLIKVALDKVGMTNNPDEYVNSIRLKPFLPKVFDVTPCGTISLVERVQPVTCLAEAKSISGDIFDLINYRIIGKYVAADIGTKFYLNWGVRYGFGPVILDLTDLYELDGQKLYCNQLLPDGSRCGGEIDYDDGFNNLICNKCNHIYEARALAKKIKTGNEIIRGGNYPMSIQLIINGEVVKTSEKVSENILPRAPRNKRRPTINFDPKTINAGMRLVINGNEINNSEPAKNTNASKLKPEFLYKQEKSSEKRNYAKVEIPNDNPTKASSTPLNQDSDDKIPEPEKDVQLLPIHSNERTEPLPEEFKPATESIVIKDIESDPSSGVTVQNNETERFTENNGEPLPEISEEYYPDDATEPDSLEKFSEEQFDSDERAYTNDSQKEFMESEGNENFSDYFKSIREGNYEVKGEV